MLREKMLEHEATKARRLIPEDDCQQFRMHFLDKKYLIGHSVTDGIAPKPQEATEDEVLEYHHLQLAKSVGSAQRIRALVAPQCPWAKHITFIRLAPGQPMPFMHGLKVNIGTFHDQAESNNQDTLSDEMETKIERFVSNVHTLDLSEPEIEFVLHQAALADGMGGRVQIVKTFPHALPQVNNWRVNDLGLPAKSDNHRVFFPMARLRLNKKQVMALASMDPWHVEPGPGETRPPVSEKQWEQMYDEVKDMS